MSSTGRYTVSSIASTYLPIRNPTDRIPYDILSAIFISIVQEEAYRISRSQSPPPSRYPWTIAGVCTRWRETCLATPRIWSYINLHHDCGKAQPPAENVRLQIERARSPMPLVIYSRAICGCENQELSWKAIAPSSHRWEEVHFGFSGDISQEKFAELLRDNTGFAKVWRITFEDSCSYSADIPPLLLPIKSNHGLINLRSLTLQLMDDLDPLQDFPWNQITRLSLPGYYAENNALLSILTKCKNLVHLDVSSDTDHFASLNDISKQFGKASVCLPCLASLAVADELYVYVMYILPFLRLPSLRSLSIGFSDMLEEWPDDYDLIMSILDLFASLPSVMELTVESPCYEPENSRHLVVLLRKFPQLRVLDFKGSFHILSDILCQEVDNNYLCPLLEHLRLGRKYRFDADEAIRMVECRMKQGATPASLRSIHISYDVSYLDVGPEYQDAFDECQSILVDGLEKFTNNGLELRFIPLSNECDIVSESESSSVYSF